ncbi:MAG: hypothetical protein IT536_10755, partial [Hyphomicrobiales bacterium]|nr:hypothetical protein [Hyphomicrobiales bacterium]
MRLVVSLFAIVAAAIVAAWSWLGAAVEMPQAPMGPTGQLDCVSYAPFRGDQNPLGAGTVIAPWQIDADLAQLKPLTNCIRTYSIDHGLDRIPEVARKHGFKVLHGLWLSSLPDLNRRQIETTIDLANRYPDVIAAVIVGNEVLLRGEMSAADLTRVIREVKAKVPMRVTYADVWEFWLRHRDVATAVDFVTVHILPYWEDHPIPVEQAARHVSLIRRQVVDAFPGKEVFLGEFGWPSAGRMREGALPSPANAARVLHEVVALGKREDFRVNLIEAYDQPWKRKLEGTVGGYWGLYDAYERRAKFVWGSAVSNHPRWRWQAMGGIAFAALVFAVALVANRRQPLHVPSKRDLSTAHSREGGNPESAALQAGSPLSRGRADGEGASIRTKRLAVPGGRWLRVAAIALVAGTLIGWTAVLVSIESLTAIDWMRSLAWATVAFAAPLAGAAAAVRGAGVPALASLLGRREGRPRD